MNHKMKPVHPGVILREDVLKEMQVTVAEAAKGLQINEQQLTDVLNELMPVSAELALRLESGFGINADFWLDLQKKYDIWIVQESGQVKNIHRFGQAVA